MRLLKASVPPQQTFIFAVLRMSSANQKNMAVTHHDVSQKNQTPFISSEQGLALMVFCILCGFAGFVLSLAAEATRSEATWLLLSTNGAAQVYQCFYSGSGKTPLACGVIAFFMLAIAMFVVHLFIITTLKGPRTPGLVAWNRTYGAQAPSSSTLSRRLCFLFFTTWVSFSIAEILLIVGLGAESGHTRNWTNLRPNCSVARPGLFATAGVFGLMTVFLAAGLYLTALRAQQSHEDEPHMVRPAAVPAEQQFTPEGAHHNQPAQADV